MKPDLILLGQFRKKQSFRRDFSNKLYEVTERLKINKRHLRYIDFREPNFHACLDDGFLEKYMKGADE